MRDNFSAWQCKSIGGCFFQRRLSLFLPSLSSSSSALLHPPSPASFFFLLLLCIGLLLCDLVYLLFYILPRDPFASRHTPSRQHNLVRNGEKKVPRCPANIYTHIYIFPFLSSPPPKKKISRYTFESIIP